MYRDELIDNTIKTKKQLSRTGNQMTETEPIEGETWCTYCKVPVDGWVVSYEPNSDTGYDKILRCPNCNKKCFDDANSGFFFLLLFVGLAISAAGLWAWLEWTGTEFDEWAEGKSVVVSIPAMFAFTILFAIAGMNIYKKHVRRLGPKK